MNLREILEHIHGKKLEKSKEPPYHYHAFALDKKNKKLILLDSVFDEEDTEEVFAHLPEEVPTFVLRVDSAKPDVARNQGLLALWLVDNDIIGAECSKILNDLERAAAEQVLRSRPDWKPC